MMNVTKKGNGFDVRITLTPAKRVRALDNLSILDVKSNYLSEIRTYSENKEDKVICAWGKYLLKKIEFYESRGFDAGHLKKGERIILTSGELLNMESTNGCFITPRQYCKISSTEIGGDALLKQKVSHFLSVIPQNIKITEGFDNLGFSCVDTEDS